MFYRRCGQAAPSTVGLRSDKFLPTAKLPGFVVPQLATLTGKAPAGEEWLHEIKFDGYRLKARWDGKKLQLFTRSGLDWTAKFGRIVDGIKALRLPPCILDGEVVVEDAKGRSDFQRLVKGLKAEDDSAFVFFVFDALHIGGRDLRELPRIDRKARLEALLSKAKQDGPVRYSSHVVGDGGEMSKHSCRLGLEGIIAKRTDAPYRSGRNINWLKVKCSARQEFVVIGWVPSTVGTAVVASLVMGYYNKGKLVHAGRVGTGYTIAVAGALAKKLKHMAASKPAQIENLTHASEKHVRWVKSNLVAEVEFRAWGTEGLLRHPSFKGLREDKKARSVVRERPIASGD